LWCGGAKEIRLSRRLKILWRGYPLPNDLSRHSPAGRGAALFYFRGAEQHICLETKVDG
jgi:hypothetical protein